MILLAILFVDDVTSDSSKLGGENSEQVRTVHRVLNSQMAKSLCIQKNRYGVLILTQFTTLRNLAGNDETGCVNELSLPLAF